MKYTISTKLLIALTAIAAVSVGVSVIVLFAMGVVSSAKDDADRARLFQQNAATSIIQFQSEANALTAYISLLDANILEEMAVTAKQLDKTLELLEAGAKSFGLEDDVFITIDGLSTWRNAIIPPLIRLLQRPDTVDLARVYVHSGSNIKAREGLVEAFNILEQSAKKIADAAGQQLGNAVAITRIATFAGLTVMLIIFVVAGMVVRRNISHPIRKISEQMDELSKGNLSIDIEGQNRSDEIGQMARAMVSFRDGISDRVALENTTATEQAKSDQRRKNLERLSERIDVVLHAASNGDYTTRVECDFDQQALNDLGKGLNDLNMTVNDGLTELVYVLSSISQGDLTQRIKGDYRGLFGDLKTSANMTADKLAQIVGQLQHSSNELNSATDEILDGANDLSERTTRQAATIEQTSAAMEQLARTVLENAERANGARRTVDTAQQTAEDGGTVMLDATHAMERITTSSSKISDIIGLIDNIAFQTNLLALNASVEAARAGEAGKGFAVVATEVRRLAQSAAQASQEVKTLIEASVDEVRGGSELVSKAASNLKTIVGSVRDVTSLMNDIADESRGQASSLEQLHAAVKVMDEMTQHNATLVEETNAAIGQTKYQVTHLNGIASQFDIGAELGSSVGSIKTAPTQYGAISAVVAGDARNLQTQAASALNASYEQEIAEQAAQDKTIPPCAAAAFSSRDNVKASIGNAALSLVNEADIDDWDEF